MTAKHPGRPPLGHQRMRRVNVSLDDSHKEIAERLGEGKGVSEGIRRALRIAVQLIDALPRQ